MKEVLEKEIVFFKGLILEHKQIIYVLSFGDLALNQYQSSGLLRSMVVPCPTFL
jgi:hypothetical protein